MATHTHILSQCARIKTLVHLQKRSQEQLKVSSHSHEQSPVTLRNNDEENTFLHQTLHVLSKEMQKYRFFLSYL